MYLCEVKTELMKEENIEKLGLLIDKLDLVYSEALVNSHKV